MFAWCVWVCAYVCAHVCVRICVCMGLCMHVYVNVFVNVVAWRGQGDSFRLDAEHDCVRLREFYNQCSMGPHFDHYSEVGPHLFSHGKWCAFDLLDPNSHSTSHKVTIILSIRYYFVWWWVVHDMGWHAGSDSAIIALRIRSTQRSPLMFPYSTQHLHHITNMFVFHGRKGKGLRKLSTVVFAQTLPGLSICTY